MYIFYDNPNGKKMQAIVDYTHSEIPRKNQRDFCIVKSAIKGQE